MTRRASKSGFTLLEILVASMLLAMLITILTMVFNSSSIAWSTGKASVAEMDEVRQKMAAASIVADSAVPRVDVNDQKIWGQLVSPWNSDGTLRHRGVVQMSESKVGSRVWGDLALDNDIKSPNKELGKDKWARATSKFLWGTLRPGNVNISGGTKAYVVGVWSYGPDGRPNSGDDISTWPDVE